MIYYNEMKALVFSVSLRNHTFNIRTTPQSTLCYYDNKGKYTTSLTFATNTYASVEYKNVWFSGRVTKQNKWTIRLDHRPIIRKHFDRFYYLTKEENEGSHAITAKYPDKILWLYDHLVDHSCDQYLCIEDKETFKDQVCAHLLQRYSDDELDDLDKIVECENWDDIGPDEEPGIEKISLRDLLIEKCQEFIDSFRQAEVDAKNIKETITLEKVINETPSLSQFPYGSLKKELCLILDEGHFGSIKPDIWYSLDNVLMDIGVELSEACEYALFIDTIEKRIDRLLSSMAVEDIDKDELYSYFKTNYRTDNIPDDDKFEQDVREYVTFLHLYEKFYSLFNCDHIKIEWDADKLSLFQKYDKDGQIADPQNLAEYEAYKYVMPFYRKHFLRKNSNRYKPVIEQLPAFISYVSTVLDILFAHDVLTDTGDTVVYNDNGDIDQAFKEIEATLE